MSPSGLLSPSPQPTGAAPSTPHASPSPLTAAYPSPAAHSSSSSSLLSPTGQGNSAGASGAAYVGLVEFGSQQPVFTQYGPNSKCHCCGTRCTFSSGRHHCRCCGNIVCQSCAKDRVYLTWTKQRSRTCDK